MASTVRPLPPTRRGVDPRDLAEAVFDAVRIGIIVLDHRFCVQYLNYAAEVLLGVSLRQATDRPIGDFIETGQDVVEMLNVTLREAQPVARHDFTLRVRNHGSLRTDSFVATANLPDNQPGLIWEILELDSHLRRVASVVAADLDAANRVMLGSFAHEVKNPLGGIRGAAQLLERELPDQSLREFTEVIISESDRLRKLVDRMVSPESDLTPFAPVNIHEVLERVRLVLTSDDTRRVAIERDYDPSIPEVDGSFDQLVQAFLNIAKNAVQSIEESGRDGRVILRTRVAGSVRLLDERPRMALRVEVEDDGPGVPEHLQAQIFFPLVSGRPKGTGLGLSIARTCLTRHGSILGVESRPGKTVFTAFLPVHRDE